MTTKVIPPEWSDWDNNMCVNVGDMKEYYTRYTEPTNSTAKQNKEDLGLLDVRVKKLEQSTPVGPGGKGAFLDLGGTPQDWPTKPQMDAAAGDLQSPESTSFLVIARNDGLYFYNPKTKVIIPPKPGGGLMAVHGNFPQIFDNGHKVDHNGRVGMSGVYTANLLGTGLDAGGWMSHQTAQLLVVVTDEEEFHTALHVDGTATRVFRKDQFTADWSFHAGGGSGGGGTGGNLDPAVIAEINRRLAALEAISHESDFLALTDTPTDYTNQRHKLIAVNDTENGLKFTDQTIEDLIEMQELATGMTTGKVLTNANGVAGKYAYTTGNMSAGNIAACPFLVLNSPTDMTVNLIDIVAMDSPTLSNSQIREGRITYFSNVSSTGKRFLKLKMGQEFYRDGVYSTVDMVIPPNTCFVMVPVIITGAPVWAYLGQMHTAEPITRFTHLSDTPQSFVNSGGKVLAVKADDSGIEFVDKASLVDLTAVEDRLDNLEADMILVDGRLDALEAGGGTGGGSSTFLGLTDTPMGYLGAAGKTVAVNAAGNGLEFVDGGGDVTKLALSNGNSLPIDAKGVNSQTYTGWNTVPYSDSAKYEKVLFWGTSTNRGYELPDIVAYNTEVIAANSQVRVGRTITISNKGTTNKFIKPATDCYIYRTEEDKAGGQFNLLPGHTIILTAHIKDSTKYWMLMGSHGANQTPDSADLKTGLMNGDQQVSWNTLSSDPMATSGDVTQANIAAAPFAVGMGSTANKQFQLPDIVDRTVTSITSTQVREGRMTWLANIGSVTREIILNNNCKFNVNGSTNTTRRYCLPGEVHVYIPGIYSNGDKVWTFIGMFHTAGTDNQAQLDALEATVNVMQVNGIDDLQTKHTVQQAIIDKIIDPADRTYYWDSNKSLGKVGTREGIAVASGDLVTNDVIIHKPNDSTSGVINLSEVVIKTATPTTTQVRLGRRIVLVNQGTVDSSVRPSGSQKIIGFDGVGIDNYVLEKQHVLTLQAGTSVTAGNGWFIVSDTPATSADHSFTTLNDVPHSYAGEAGKSVVVNATENGLEFKELPDVSAEIDALKVRADTLEDWQDKAKTGESSVRIDGRVVQRPPQVKDGNFSAAETNAKDVVIVRGTAARTVTMPEIVVATATAPSTEQARVGRMFTISNYSTQDTTINASAGQRFVSWDGSTATSHTLPAAKTVTMVAAYWNGTNSGNAWHIIRDDYAASGGSGGASSFVGLSDTPSSFSGHAGKAAVVNAGATAIEFAAIPTSAAVDANTAWRTKVESGDSGGKVNSNCMFGAMQIKDGALSATELATCTAGYVIGSTARTCTLPKVVDVNASSVAANEARFGKQIRMVNMSTQTMTINVQGSGRIYKPDNTWSTSVTIAPQKYADFHAVWWPGGGFNNFAWVMMVP